MHLLDAARTTMSCIPFVHEVSAATACEYFNEISNTERAFCLVTAGPGLTNLVTALGSAFLESRELLVVGGQVKSSDLSRGEVRQRGIQEIDGEAIVRPLCKATLRIEHPIADATVLEAVQGGATGRKGPVFIEMCLDAQGASFGTKPDEHHELQPPRPESLDGVTHELLATEIAQAKRPILLVGGGVNFETAHPLHDALIALGVPLMTTWNGADRVQSDHPMFMGRPNTWGQRSANILLSQADLIVALGTRLGLQQTGFNWQEWTNARVIQVDIDPAELGKGHPRVDVALCADANAILAALADLDPVSVPIWIDHCRRVREILPDADPANSNDPAFISPFALVSQISDDLGPDDVLIPASSGSGQFVPMMVFRNKGNQRILTNKGSASMGYGLAGAIGAALAVGRDRRTVLIEGDGSFSQNLQELGTAQVQDLNLKIFLLDNDGYASIRTTQRNYFDGAYLGCDAATGLGFPDWTLLARAFGIPSVPVGPEGLRDPGVQSLLTRPGPGIFIAKIDPKQTYFPKVSSRIAADGSMISNPVHQMTPPLDDETLASIALPETCA